MAGLSGVFPLIHDRYPNHSYAFEDGEDLFECPLFENVEPPFKRQKVSHDLSQNGDHYALEEMSLKICHLEELNKILSDRNERLNERLESRGAEVTFLELKNNDLTKKNLSLEQEKTSLKAQGLLEEKRVQDLTSSSIKVLGLKDKEIKRLKFQVSFAQADFKLIKTALEERNQSLSEKADAIQSQLSHVREKGKAKKRKISELGKSNEELKKANTALQSKVSKALKQVQETEIQVSHLKEKGKAKKRKISELGKSNEELKKANTSLQSKVSKALEDTGVMEKQMNELEIQAIIAQGKNNALSDECSYVKQIQDAIHIEAKKYSLCSEELSDCKSAGEKAQEIMDTLFFLKSISDEKEKQLIQLQGEISLAQSEGSIRERDKLLSENKNLKKTCQALRTERDVSRKNRDESRNECLLWEKKWSVMSNMITNLSKSNYPIEIQDKKIVISLFEG